MYNIREVFHQIDKDIDLHKIYLSENEKYVMREIHNHHGNILFLASEPVNKRKMLILPVRSRINTHELQRFPSCKGVQLKCERIEKVGPLKNQWCIMLLQSGSYDNSIFEMFIVNICETIWSVVANDIIREFQKTMQKWQFFFSKLDTAGLLPDEQRGLYGELDIMRLLLDQNSHPAIVESWRGPLREDVDYIFGDTGVEVKTTMTKKPIKVRISNERQLSVEVDVTELFLAVVILERSLSEGETLNQAVNAVREKLKEWPLSLDSFNQRLIQAGYLDAHSVRYENEKYSVIDRKYYKIEDGFPRLIPSTMPKGIENVKYDIVLDGYEKYQVHRTEFIKCTQGV